jgi:hypothetical protein
MTDTAGRERPVDDWYTYSRLLAIRGGRSTYIRVGLPYQNVALSRVRSWAEYDYPRFGAWFHYRGLTLRYRDWLLHFTVRS